MAAWLGLIGALLGTTLGGLITYLVAAQKNKYDRQIENNRRLIISFESIHDLLSTISEQASTLNMGVIGDLGYGTPLKGDILKEKMQLTRLRMLVDFYVPALREDIKNITAEINIIFRAAGEVMLLKDRTDTWKTKTVEASAFATINIAKYVQTAQEKLASLVQPLVESA